MISHTQALVLHPIKTQLGHCVFFVLYAVVSAWAYQTVGIPLQDAYDDLMEEAAKKNTVVDLDALSEETLESLPSRFFPSPLPLLCLVLVVSLHILFVLSQHWSAALRVYMGYRRPSKGETPNALLITPDANRGDCVVCPLESTGQSKCLEFSFQRHRFEYDSVSGKCTEICPDVTRRVSDYISNDVRKPETSWIVGSHADILKRQKLYGKNVVSVNVPPLVTMLLEQLVRPIPVFQTFSCALWAVDEYLRYTVMTLISIIGFELTTTIQKRKSLLSLQAMGSHNSSPGASGSDQSSTSGVFVEAIRFNGIGPTGVWTMTNVSELVPGDRVRKLGDSVPCDLLITRGSAIVNEASLTGESVPQMKDSVGLDDPSRALDIEGADKHSVLFAGTSVMSQSADLECTVLRTGIHSTRGTLLSVVEFGSKGVDSEQSNKDTLRVLLLLLGCALVAVAYIVYEHVTETDPESKLGKMKMHKLLLRCIMVITSVVPPELPLQLTISVNTALMALTALSIFCTEPFRVPIAGRVSCCLFDKTGTLTTDLLQCHGCVLDDKQASKEPAVGSKGPVVGSKGSVVGSKGSGVTDPRPIPDLPEDAGKMARVVIAGCHSLSELSGKLIGDPIEVSAFVAAQCHVDSGASTTGANCAFLLPDKSAVKIHSRHQFSSALQRMSTVASVSGQWYVLCKGSPETVLTLLAKSYDNRSWYTSTYSKLANEGYRVIALAYKAIPQASTMKREEAESGLSFAGFLAFSCEVRRDTGLVIAALMRDAKLHCAMVTGDAVLTAIHVAKEVGMVRHSTVRILSVDNSGRLTESRHNPESGTKYSDSDLDKASVVAGSDIDAMFAAAAPCSWVCMGSAIEAGGQHLERHYSSICVFARMSPMQKERVVRVLNSQGHAPLMCGDGANDMGALKQASVGVALLSGFGSANTGQAIGNGQTGSSTGSLTATESNSLTTTDSSQVDSQEVLELEQKIVKYKEKQLAKKYNSEFAARKKELMSSQQDWLQEEMRKPGMSYWTAVMSVTTRLRREMGLVNQELQSKYGAKVAWQTNPQNMTAALQEAANAMNAEDSTALKMGDASLAAPFTSRLPSIKSVIEIVKQGRCTLLLTLQTMEIMILQSLISAHSMAVTTVEGGRTTEMQMMASSVVLMVATFAFTYSKPSKRLSSTLPLRSVFHPAIWVSVVLQVIIHIAVHDFSIQLARAAMGEAGLKALYAFEQKRDDKVTNLLTGPPDEAESDSMFLSVFSSGKRMLQVFAIAPYMPNELNTITFLVKTAQQLSILLVNYKGSPWMTGIMENRALFFSIIVCAAALFVTSAGVFPLLNRFLELKVLESSLRLKVLQMLAVSLLGCFVVDRMCLYIFARDVFRASVVEPLKSVRASDVLSLAFACAKLLAGAAAFPFVIGNPLMMFAAWWIYRKYRAHQDAAEESYIKRVINSRKSKSE